MALHQDDYRDISWYETCDDREIFDSFERIRIHAAPFRLPMEPLGVELYGQELARYRELLQEKIKKRHDLAHDEK